MADDGYISWYQSKVWQLLPGVYRAQDAVVAGVPGPLQELLNRIGAEFATLRRSIDRMWENQSIETCDDWVVPYIGDLLATRLVSCLDSRAQRLDVAKTIYYRRRAGTLGLLEELVSDIASRDARAVEFFRRLGRTRHQFDPPIGNVFAADAAPWAPDTTYEPGDIVANGLNTYVCTGGGISAASGTGPSGGGSLITDGSVTWSFYKPLASMVPAVIEGLAGANSRTPAGGFADLRNAYAAANTGSAFDEFSYTADLRAGAQSFGRYNISHLGMFVWWLHSYPIIGATPVAGPLSTGAVSPCFTFDPSGRNIPLFAPSARTAASFGDDWASPDEWDLPVAIRELLWSSYPDQLYPAAFAVLFGAGGAPAPMARSAVTIHPETGLFSFTASPPVGTTLTQYHFGQMSTTGAGGFPLDQPPSIALPTTAQPAATGTWHGTAFDGSTSIATDTTIAIQDSQTYPGLNGTFDIGANTLALTVVSGQRPLIRWAAGGATWTIDGSGGNLIIQGIWLQGADLVLTGTFASVTLRYVTLDPGTAGTTAGSIGKAIDDMWLAPTRLWVQASIDRLSLVSCITGPIRRQKSPVSGTFGVIEQLTASDSIIQAINTGSGDTDYAFQTESGNIALQRCTVLGPSAIHRLDASECILDDTTVAEDVQHGCVRFSAIAQGSQLHAPYRSVTVPPVGPIFFSRRFGEPEYARLLRQADAAIIDPQPGDSILGGAQNGSEMGAYQREGLTLKKRGLVLKFEEYAPLGVFPVWIDAD